MPKRSRAAILPTNVALLQNLIKRDPQSYKEEFKTQYQHYDSLKNIHSLNPHNDQGQQEFAELIGFITQMVSCYPKETSDFPDDLCGLVAENYDALSSELSEKIVQCIAMLRNKEQLSDDKFVKTVFPILVATESKALRTQIYAALIAMLKNVNKPVKSPRVNKMVQAMLFDLLESTEANGLWATKIVRELWRRGVWDDSRSVEIMIQAALHQDTKVASTGIRFFMGADQEREDAMAEEESDSDLDMGAMQHRLNINKKTGKRAKKLKSAAAQVKRKRNGPGKDSTHLNFSALHLMRDPQGFCEKLYNVHLSGAGSAGAPARGARFTLEQKLQCLSLVSRIIGTHKLYVLGIYSYLLKYLTPKQKDVTQFMAAAAQASHDMVPPDAISPIIRKIADEFVSEGVASEVAAAGLNTIREILARAPLAIDETLLHDLIEYRGSKAKNVMMAARGLITLFRDIDPSMLPARERGKSAQMALRAGDAEKPQFGKVAAGGIEGLELLDQWKANNEEEANNEKAWEVDSEDEDSDSDEGEWVTVESDKEYEVSGSDDEDEKDADKPAAAAAAPAAPAAKTLEELQKLASTEILTPADFAKLDELKNEANVRRAMGQTNEEIVDALKLTGPSKFKQTKEERVAAAMEGKQDREFGSRKAKHMDKEHSTTNKQKARKKNPLMLIHKREVKGKAKRSLRDTQKVLRAHVKRQKMKKK